MSELAEMANLIREKTTSAFFKDWKVFMDVFLKEGKIMIYGFKRLKQMRIK